MKKLENKFYLIILSIIALGSAFFLSSLDWQESWTEPIGLGFAIFLVVFAMINFKNLILFLIILLPGITILNGYKINLAKYLPSLEYYNLPANILAITCLFIIITGAISLFTNWEKAKKIPLSFVLALYSLTVIFSILWSADKPNSLSGAIYFIAPFFMYIITYCYFNSKDNLIKIITFSIASSFLPIIISIYQIITNDFFYEPDSTLKRLSGPFTHPNLFGLYLFIALSLLIIFYLSKKEDKLSKNKFIIVYGGVLLISLILTYSRVSWLSFGVFLIIIALVRKKFAKFLAITSPIAVVIFSMIESIRMRAIELFNSAIFNSWIARKNIWQVSWGEIMKKPILGYGVGSSEKVIEAAKTWKGGASIPHNDFLLYALELGAVGVILFITYTVASIYKTFLVFKNEENKNVTVRIFGKNIEINFKILSFGVLSILLATIPAIFFESTSRRIINQIIIWAILGSLFGSHIKDKKNA